MYFRSLTISFAKSFSCLESASVLFLYPIVAGQVGPLPFHMVMFVLNTISLVWIVYYVPETAHQPVHELVARWVTDEHQPLLEDEEKRLRPTTTSIIH